ncbi:hypothetical protein phiV141_39 [Vibrio phage phiV141]|uniref:Uncharacterized protein n=1 Tax=Vibrio phage phiV141 TaxID=2723905 RepID=A0A7D7EXX6_9CAUD|nr:hypothetical protein phiV141_39 [Vibrio phage phiV141]
MAYSYQEEVSNGVRTLYPVEFDFINQDDVYVYTGEHADYEDQVSYRWYDDTTIELLNVAVDAPAGTKFHIRRVTNREELTHKFATASIRGEALDEVNLQCLHLVQESSDGFQVLTGSNLSQADLDMLGNQILNCVKLGGLEEAVDGDEAVSLDTLRRYLYNLEEGLGHSDYGTIAAGAHLQLRRDTQAANSTFTGKAGEPVYLTDKKCLALHNGVEPGGDIQASERYVDTAQNDLLEGALYKGSNGIHVDVGDDIPVGTTHLRIVISGNEFIVAAWDDLVLPARVTAVPTADNGFKGYDIVTDQGTFEFVTLDVHDKRSKLYVTAWGAGSGSASVDTEAFKRAAANGGKVVVPTNTYTINADELVIEQDNTSFEHVGVGFPVINSGSAGFSLFKFGNYDQTLDYRDDNLPLFNTIDYWDENEFSPATPTRPRHKNLGMSGFYFNVTHDLQAVSFYGRSNDILNKDLEMTVDGTATVYALVEDRYCKNVRNVNVRNANVDVGLRRGIVTYYSYNTKNTDCEVNMIPQFSPGIPYIAYEFKHAVWSKWEDCEATGGLYGFSVGAGSRGVAMIRPKARQSFYACRLASSLEYDYTDNVYVEDADFNGLGVGMLVSRVSNLNVNGYTIASPIPISFENERYMVGSSLIPGEFTPVQNTAPRVFDGNYDTSEVVGSHTRYYETRVYPVVYNATFSKGNLTTSSRAVRFVDAIRDNIKDSVTDKYNVWDTQRKNGLRESTRTILGDKVDNFYATSIKGVDFKDRLIVNSETYQQSLGVLFEFFTNGCVLDDVFIDGVRMGDGDFSCESTLKFMACHKLVLGDFDSDIETSGDNMFIQDPIDLTLRGTKVKFDGRNFPVQSNSMEVVRIRTENIEVEYDTGVTDDGVFKTFIPLSRVNDVWTNESLVMVGTSVSNNSDPILVRHSSATPGGYVQIDNTAFTYQGVFVDGQPKVLRSYTDLSNVKPNFAGEEVYENGVLAKGLTEPTEPTFSWFRFV